MRTATVCSDSIFQEEAAFAKSRKACFAERLNNRPRKCLNYRTPADEVIILEKVSKLNDDTK